MEGDCMKSWLRVAGVYIMDSSPIRKRKDEAKYGDYRTKLLILDIYDRMQAAIDSGRPYQTILDPPPPTPRWRTLRRRDKMRSQEVRWRR